MHIDRESDDCFICCWTPVKVPIYNSRYLANICGKYEKIISWPTSDTSGLRGQLPPPIMAITHESIKQRGVSISMKQTNYACRVRQEGAASLVHPWPIELVSPRGTLGICTCYQTSPEGHDTEWSSDFLTPLCPGKENLCAPYGWILTETFYWQQVIRMWEENKSYLWFCSFVSKSQKYCSFSSSSTKDHSSLDSHYWPQPPPQAQHHFPYHLLFVQFFWFLHCY